MKEASKMVKIVGLLLWSMCLAVQANRRPDILMTTVKLREDLRIGEYAFSIIASDPEGDELTYFITGQNAYYFTVDEHTGNVTVRSEMDREKTDTFPVTIEVSDGTSKASKTVVIILEDANDNKPMFSPPSYFVDIPENTTVDTVIFQVKATDEDIGLAKTIVYKIDSVVPSSGFDLFSVYETTGEVKLEGQLSSTSKSNFYQIKFSASDKGGMLYGEHVIQSNVAFASVTVIDVPDLDPQFINLPYSVTVNEQTPVGTTVFQVQAIDPDTWINAKIVYSIQDTNAPGLFMINENTGDIVIQSVFDREEFVDNNALVTLKVKAQETTENIHGVFANTSANVEITIGDINDNKPEFYDCKTEPCVLATSFSGYINEHSPPGEPVNGLNILAEDIDEGSNSRFTLELAGPDKDAFTVFPQSAIANTQVEIRVRNSQDVDYEEKKIMTVEVVATDSSNTYWHSTATVTIEINDINDNSPIFQHETNNLDVKEHTKNGYIIATITATDPDTADIDNITYKLLPQNILRYIDVHPRNGSIYVVNDRLLDREVISSITATLEATDSDNKSGRTILVITLLDINDMTPHIPRKTYNEFVSEGPDGKVLIPIQATDGDEEGTDNSRIQYSITDAEFGREFRDNFTIDKDTGLLQNKGPLDREAINISLNGEIRLNVSATDMGVPSRSTEVMVIITVEDINDNAPKFENNSYIFFVKESEMGAFVGSVFAHDEDQTVVNNRISFRITDGSFGNFFVITSAAEDGSGYFGDISVDRDVELDYEQGRRSYNLKVEATDTVSIDLADVEVIVLDVNDERPVLPKGFTLHVPENTSSLGEVGKIEAQDPDTNSSLIYELLSTQCHCNGTMGPCDEDWFTLESSGVIIVNEDFVIDYEKCDQVILEVQVVDVWTEKGENHSIPDYVTINIDDINDNAPTFIKSDGVFVVLSENTQQGTSVAHVLATDTDSGNNKVIKFEVLSVQFINTNNDQRPIDKPFSVETTAVQDIYKGDIRCLGSLDSTLRGKYLVTVEAKDTGNLATATQIEIYTIDRSYRVGLRFENSVEAVSGNLPEITRALSGATGAIVHILEVVAESTKQRRAYSLGTRTITYNLHVVAEHTGRRETEITVLGAYFIYPNGSALDSNTVERMLQDDPYSAGILRKYGLTYIVSGDTEPKDADPVFIILIGLVAGLTIVLVVMITSLMCTQRSYKRKLKAAKAMSTAAMRTENHTSGAVVPGTNKYTMDGANPVLNMNIDAATDLGFDEEASSHDKASLNSFDYSMDTNIMEKDDMQMTMIQEEDEEDEEDTYEDYIEPLSAALAQQSKNKVPQRHMNFENPSFDTTDL